MNGFSTSLPGCRNHTLDREVACPRFRTADQIGFVAKPRVQGAGVGFGIDRDAPYAEAPGRARDAAGNFTSVGDEDGAQHVTASERVKRARSTHCVAGAAPALGCAGAGGEEPAAAPGPQTGSTDGSRVLDAVAAAGAGGFPAALRADLRSLSALTLAGFPFGSGF